MPSSHAASFDCEKSATPVEKMICAGPELSNLDDEMAAAYNVVLAGISGTKWVESLKLEQRSWLLERNDCMDAACLKSAYQYRLEELNPWQQPGTAIKLMAENPPLCDGYKRYIEGEVAGKMRRDMFRHNSSPVCQRTFSDGFPEFIPAEWREISPEDHPALAVQAFRYLNYWPWDRKEVANSLSEHAYKDQLEAVIKSHSANRWHMWLAEADINNDGLAESLLKVEDGRCGSSGSGSHPPRWQKPIMVVDESGDGIDTVKSEWLLQVTVLPASRDHWPPYTTPIPGLHHISLTAFDVFTFSGKVFFDQWTDYFHISSNESDDRYAASSIYSVSHNEATEVCHFKFKKLLD